MEDVPNYPYSAYIRVYDRRKTLNEKALSMSFLSFLSFITSADTTLIIINIAYTHDMTEKKSSEAI